MFYREAGQFKTSYQADQALFPIRQDQIGIVLLLAVAFILVPLSELLRGIGGLRIVFYGLFLVIFIVALPEGIFHYIERKYHQFERWVEVEK